MKTKYKYKGPRTKRKEKRKRNNFPKIRTGTQAREKRERRPKIPITIWSSFYHHLPSSSRPSHFSLPSSFISHFRFYIYKVIDQ